MTKIMSPEELEQELRAIGAERYHDKHPFHKLLHGGKLNKGQVQAWALNRYCYQSAVPRKDAALISRCHDREMRRDWVHRMLDHDGYGEEEGGIERWLVLTDGLGLDRDYVVSMKGALPATRFAVEAYVNFVREKTLVEAVASSLTELFAPKIHKERISGMLENYDFISDDVMQYFKRRLTQAPRDADFALDYVKRNARTPEAQSGGARRAADSNATCCGRSSMRCIIAYVRPGHDSARRLRAGKSMMAEAHVPWTSDCQTQETRPYLPAYLKLRHDAGRGRWVLLAPERVLTPDETAVAVLKLCDGKRSVEEIAEALAKDYAAPVDVIRKDVLDLLQGLADKGYIKA